MTDKSKITPPPKTAAGPKAVLNALSYVTKRMTVPRAYSVLTHLNQKQGIDCPGCAWPDPARRSRLGEFCENGVKAISEEAIKSKVDGSFFTSHKLDELIEKSDYWLGQRGRLLEPVIRKAGKSYFEPIRWEEAFNLIAKELINLSQPDEAVFYTSGRTSNEAAFLYQLFVRKFGTNNLPDCSNMCHESSGVGLKETLGIGKGSVTLEDFEKAELIIVMGQNPGTNHPRMLTSLEKAKKKGARIITVNPLREVGLESFKNPQTIKGVFQSTSLTDKYLQVRINEDVALLKCWLQLLLEYDTLDHEFIRTKTNGYEEFVKDIKGYDLNELMQRTGLDSDDIRETASWIGDSKRIIICWAMGLTQHVNAVDNIREIVNLLLARGSLGKPGAGTCPVRGHSNVQGDRTMGIWERPTKEWVDRLQAELGFDPPRKAGYNVVESIEAMAGKKVKFFMSLGGNLLPAAPDTYLTQSALQNCNMTVHVSTKLNRTHLYPGKVSIILPCFGRTDKDQMVTVENSMGVVHGSSGVLSPPGEFLKSEPEIVSTIASRVLKDDLDWRGLGADYSKIRDLISRTIPGFEEFNQRLEKQQGFALPNGARTGNFKTASGKAEFTINKLPDPPEVDHKYLMMTIRSHDQFNTTIYGMDDRYRGIFNQRMVVFMNKRDMEEEGLSEGDSINLFNQYGNQLRSVQGFKVVPYNIPVGCLATYFPEANPLVPLRLTARGSHTPASKSVCVDIEKT